MPGKKKGKRKSKSSSKSGGRKSAAALKSLSQVDPHDTEHLPVPPTAREQLVDLLKKNEVKEKEIFNVKVSTKVLSNLSSQDIRDLKDVFEMLDVKRKGALTLTDLRRGLWILGFRPSREDVYEMMRDSAVKDSSHSALKDSAGSRKDSAGSLVSRKESAMAESSERGTSVATSYLLSGRCDLNQFLELVIDCQASSRDRLAELQTAFNLFDLENTGLVTLETMSDLNKRHGAGLTEDELREMLEFADFRGDGVIDVQEFVRTMGQTNIFEGVTMDR